jgi:DnaJ-class molecular chaperone
VSKASKKDYYKILGV